MLWRTSTTSAASPCCRLLTERLQELVVDPDVGDRAGRGAGGGADRHAEQRDEEDQADQAAPQGAARSAGGGRAAGLVQLDLAVIAGARRSTMSSSTIDCSFISCRSSSETVRAVFHIGVRNSDQVAHGGSVALRRVTPDHPPGVIRRDPAAGDAGPMSEDDVARLQSEVEELRAANAKLENRVARRARLRRAALVLLLVLGCGLFAASLIAVWTRATVLNTDRYVKTMAPIGESKAVQEAVADKLAARINGAIDFNAARARDAPGARGRAGAGDRDRRAVRGPGGARPLRRLRALRGPVGGGEPAGARSRGRAVDDREVRAADARRTTPSTSTSAAPSTGSRSACASAASTASPTRSRRASTAASRC